MIKTDSDHREKSASWMAGKSCRSFATATSVLALLSACETPSGALEPEVTEAQPDAPSVVGSNNLVTSIVKIEPDGTRTLVRIDGEISAKQRQMAANPAAFRDAPVVVDEEIIQTVEPDGSRTVRYHAFTTPNEPVNVDNRLDELATPPGVDEGLRRELAIAADGDLLLVSMRLAAVPPWAVPPRADPALVSRADYEALQSEREQAVDERKQTVLGLADELLAAIDDAGGRLDGVSWRTGWVHAAVPAAELAAFFERPDLLMLVSERSNEPVDAAASPGSLGRQRAAVQLDADKYWEAGNDGSRQNVQHTGVGDILVGVVETFKVLDEACAFDGTASCGASRFHEKYECDNASCVLVNDVDPVCPQPICSSFHPTIVTSVLAGDYTHQQGRGRSLNDPDWKCAEPEDCSELDHSPDWEASASGLVPRANIVFASFEDAAPFFTVGRLRAYETMTERPPWGFPVDIMNMSHVSGHHEDLDCPVDPTAVGATRNMEEQLENAFAEGIFLVGAAGNTNGATDDRCTVGAASSLPVVFTVNAYDASDPACQADQTDCLLDAANSARGGGFVVGTTRKRAVIDAVAPNKMTHCTRHPYDWPEGQVSDDANACAGTSVATPAVAGAAALVKDEFLSEGHTWINSPGRLHTVMLSMTDRHYDPDLPGTPGATQRRKRRANSWYGLGRLKLRHGGAGNYPDDWHFRSQSFSDFHGFRSFEYNQGEPLPASTEVFKCVQFHHEYMYNVGKTDAEMNRFKLTVEILDAGLNETCDDDDWVLFSRTDNQVDNKKLVAVEAADVGGFYNTCARITTTKVGSLYFSPATTNTMCRAHAVMDDDYVP